MFHEALDGGKAGVILVAQSRGDVALNIEGQALFRLAGEEVHVTAHRPEKILRLDEQVELAL